MHQHPAKLTTLMGLFLITAALVFAGISPAASQSPLLPGVSDPHQGGDDGKPPQLTPAPTFLPPDVTPDAPSGAPAVPSRGPGPNGELRIIFKYKEGSSVRLVNGQFTAPSPSSSLVASFAAVQAAVQRVNGARLSRLFTLPEAQLEAERQTALRNMAAVQAFGARGDVQGARVQAYDLNLFYAIDLPLGTTPAQAQALLNTLLADQSLEAAYFALPPAPPPSDIPPTTPNYQSSQFYLNPAPNGIDALYAWTRPGGKGAWGAGNKVRVIDIEYDWEFQHEDLPITASDLVSGELFTFYGPDHGTAVVGIMGAIDNSYGVTGIVNQAQFKVAGMHFNGGIYDSANAVAQASANASLGTVILVEAQLGQPASIPPCPVGCSCPPDANLQRYVPVEHDLATFQAISNATLNGRVVVLTAGNGFNDLDWAGWGGIYNRTVRDSGAIFVGAGQSYFYGAGARTAHCYSNFGSRIDVQGIGDSIVTTGYGDLFDGNTGGGPDARQLYTQSFGGTSSSGPIVAGAAVSVQSVSWQTVALYFPSRLMRQFLRMNGTPQTGSRLIGPLPNLKAALTELQPDTIGIFRPLEAKFYLRNSNTTGPANLSFMFGTPNDLPVAGDWNGDGVDTIGLFRPSTGQWFLRDSNTSGAPTYAFSFGAPGDLPTAGDWDGDGRDGIGVFRNGRFYLRNALSTGGANFTVTLGTAGDRPVAGDWNVDLVDSPGVYRPTTSQFFLTNSVCNCVAPVNASATLGLPGDVGIAGDWNADSRSTIGVFRPTNGRIFLRNSNSTGPGDITIVYGVAGDRPITGRWAAQ